MGKKKPFVKRLKDFWTKDRLARMAYLIAMTSLTTGFIICVLLIVEILVPYLKIQNYVDSRCVTLNSSYTVGDMYTGWKFEDKDVWPKCRPGRKEMTYPCALIYVTHVWKKQTILGLLHEDEYNLMRTERQPIYNCTFSKCTTSTTQNAEEIHQLVNKYGKPKSEYNCLVDPTNPANIVIGRFHSQKQVLMATLIPAGMFFFGLIMILIMTCAIGCEVWGRTGYGATAQWEKSIKWTTNDNAPGKKSRFFKRGNQSTPNTTGV